MDELLQIKLLTWFDHPQPYIGMDPVSLSPNFGFIFDKYFVVWRTFVMWI